MTDDNLAYLCGDCNRIRKEEDVKMEKVSEKAGEVPICKDTRCSVENANPLSRNKEKPNLRNPDEFRIEKELK